MRLCVATFSMSKRKFSVLAAVVGLMLLSLAHGQEKTAGRGFEAMGMAHRSQNVEPQHPPHKKKRDDAEDNVCHPLAGGFWFSKVKHSGNPSIPFSR
jgi:hypothetical protein